MNRALLLLGLLALSSAAVAQDAGVAESPAQEPESTGSRGAEPASAQSDAPPPRPPVARPAPLQEPESAPDGESDAGTPESASDGDVESESESDSDTDSDSDTETDSDSDTETEPDADTQPESVRDTESAAESDPTADESVATRVERHTETRFVPMAGDSEPDPLAAEIEELSELFGSDRSLGALAMLLLVVLLAAFAAVALRRVRDRLEPRGLFPTLLALVHLGLRLVAVAFALALLIRVLPPRASLVMLLALGGVAIAIGWSSRDVLPDLVAGFVLVFERRIRTGMWLVGDGFAGQVRRVGVRSTLLVDVMGRQVEVPNRHLVRAPLTSDASGEKEHEVLVRFESEAPAEQIRAALRDAVLASPWVLPGSEAMVLRDSDEPWLWRVRGQLLDPTLVARFEGDLLERAEEILAAFERAGRTPHDVARPTSRREGDAL